MSTPPNKVDYNDYKHLAFIRRGLILDETAFLESLINEYISYYFCPNPKLRIDLIEQILGTKRITFDGKREIMINLMKDHDKPFLLKNKSFNNDLLAIIKERNIFAHYPLDTSTSGINHIKDMTIVLTKYQDQIKGVEYNADAIEKIATLISTCIKELHQLMQEKYWSKIGLPPS